MDDLIRQEGDNPAIGFVFCREKNRAIAEYALRDNHKPIGVSEYQLTRALTEDLKERLPSVEKMERIIEEVELSSIAIPKSSIEIQVISTGDPKKSEKDPEFCDRTK